MFLPALLKLSPAIALNQKCFLLSTGDLHLLENAWRIFINKKGVGGEDRQSRHAIGAFIIIIYY